MRARPWRTIAIAVVVLACVGSPILELADGWDRAPYGDDTEGLVVLMALCVGLALSLTGRVLARMRVPSTSGIRRAMLNRIWVTPLLAAPEAANASPPSTLRI
jgi:hypothetical protein